MMTEEIVEDQSQAVDFEMQIEALKKTRRRNAHAAADQAG